MPGIRRARFFVEFDAVDVVAAIGRQRYAVLGFGIRRARLRELAGEPDDWPQPELSKTDRDRLGAYVARFNARDFDAIRAMLADDVRLDLVNRLQWEGRGKIGLYFTRYAEETKWRYVFGAVEGRPAMLVFDSAGPMERPAHFVLIDWSESRIIAIRDFLFAPYVLETIDWVRLG